MKLERVMQLMIGLAAFSVSQIGEAACVKMIQADRVGNFKVYNTCNKCQIVVVQHIGQSPNPITEHKVAPSAAVEEKMQRPTVQIITEKDCP